MYNPHSDIVIKLLFGSNFPCQICLISYASALFYRSIPCSNRYIWYTSLLLVNIDKYNAIYNTNY